MQTEFFNRLIEQLKRRKVPNAIEVIRICMEIVERGSLKGLEKSECVTGMVNDLLDFELVDFLVDEVVIDRIRTLVDSGLLQPLMDTIVDSAKGRFDLDRKLNLTNTTRPVARLNNWNAHVFGK